MTEEQKVLTQVTAESVYEVLKVFDVHNSKLLQYMMNALTMLCNKELSSIEPDTTILIINCIPLNVCYELGIIDSNATVIQYPSDKCHVRFENSTYEIIMYSPLYEKDYIGLDRTTVDGIMADVPMDEFLFEMCTDLVSTCKKVKLSLHSSFKELMEVCNNPVMLEFASKNSKYMEFTHSLIQDILSNLPHVGILNQLSKAMKVVSMDKTSPIKGDAITLSIFAGPLAKSYEISYLTNDNLPAKSWNMVVNDAPLSSEMKKLIGSIKDACDVKFNECITTFMMTEDGPKVQYITDCTAEECPRVFNVLSEYLQIVYEALSNDLEKAVTK